MIVSDLPAFKISPGHEFSRLEQKKLNETYVFVRFLTSAAFRLPRRHRLQELHPVLSSSPLLPTPPPTPLEQTLKPPPPSRTSSPRRKLLQPRRSFQFSSSPSETTREAHPATGIPSSRRRFRRSPPRVLSAFSAPSYGGFLHLLRSPAPFRRPDSLLQAPYGPRFEFTSSPPPSRAPGVSPKGLLRPMVEHRTSASRRGEVASHHHGAGITPEGICRYHAGEGWSAGVAPGREPHRRARGA
ncbi:hypothetical protein KSP39_PZI008935 [Platanthera zijinensis]|uniref:Uncharacterized protein n=1 Tax=Platanthera zijinensis TaxID=2320716 RepID=A0AAP0BMY8_9ASPA